MLASPCVQNVQRLRTPEQPPDAVHRDAPQLAVPAQKQPQVLDVPVDAASGGLRTAFEESQRGSQRAADDESAAQRVAEEPPPRHEPAKPGGDTFLGADAVLRSERSRFLPSIG